MSSRHHSSSRSRSRQHRRSPDRRRRSHSRSRSRSRSPSRHHRSGGGRSDGRHHSSRRHYSDRKEHRGRSRSRSRSRSPARRKGGYNSARNGGSNSSHYNVPRSSHSSPAPALGSAPAPSPAPAPAATKGSRKLSWADGGRGSDGDGDGDDSVQVMTEEEIAAEEKRKKEERRKKRAAIMAKYKKGSQGAAKTATAGGTTAAAGTGAGGGAGATAPKQSQQQKQKQKQTQQAQAGEEGGLASRTGVVDNDVEQAIAKQAPSDHDMTALLGAGTAAAGGGSKAPASGAAGEEEDEDGFDMFDEKSLALTAAEKAGMSRVAEATDDRNEVKRALQRSKAGAAGAHHMDWDDHEGYLKVTTGELLDGRYRVLGSRGKGVFSTVVFAQDTKMELVPAGMPKLPIVAVKIIRANDLMRRAASKEAELLRVLSKANKDNRYHVIRLLHMFEYRTHVCLVFELMHMNLAEAIHKFGSGQGINIGAVQAYAKQLMYSLYLLAKLGIVHADIKPHNIVVNEQFGNLQLCDFGSAFRWETENEPTPYLVSRFYRAPEVIMGLRHTPAVDMWSVACVLFELYTGRVLFPGDDNNDMLWRMMEYKGRFPNRILKKHFIAAETIQKEPHFNSDDMKFIRHLLDPVTNVPTRKEITITNPTVEMKAVLMAARPKTDDRRQVTQLADLLERMLMLDPMKRIDVRAALAHPFITGEVPQRGRGV